VANEVELTGSCMCGAVKIVATAHKPSVAACHCNMCRQWSSGPFMGVNCKNAEFEGEENISKIRSSDWAERGFCTKCGSNLFYHITDSNNFQIAAGLFDDQSKLRMSLQVFTDEKPDFYEFSNETRMMTGAEVVAAFTPSQD